MVKPSESELIVGWYRKIQFSNTDYDFFFSWLLIKSLRSFNTLNICLLILYYTFKSRNNTWQVTCAVCWILCMSTSWISTANYNFSSQLPKQIIKWIWSKGGSRAAAASKMEHFVIIVNKHSASYRGGSGNNSWGFRQNKQMRFSVQNEVQSWPI